MLKRLPKRPGEPDVPDDDDLLAQGFDVEYDPAGGSDTIEDAEVVEAEATEVRSAPRRSRAKPKPEPEPEPEPEVAVAVNSEPLPEPPPLDPPF